MSKKIRMTDGGFAQVSKCDFERLSVHTWYPVLVKGKKYVGRIRENFSTGIPEVVMMHDDVLGIQRTYDLSEQRGPNGEIYLDKLW